MANVRLSFHGSSKSETEEHSIVCYNNVNNEIYLALDMPDFETSFICLDRSTAIKLHRELKKQISFLESEVGNG